MWSHVLQVARRLSRALALLLNNASAFSCPHLPQRLVSSAIFGLFELLGSGVCGPAASASRLDELGERDGLIDVAPILLPARNLTALTGRSALAATPVEQRQR